MSTLRQLAGRRLWIGIPGPVLDDATKAHLEDLRPGGVVLFARNVPDRDGAARLVAELRALLGPELLISVDQEGGLVVRFDRELTVFPGNMALGAASFRELSMGEHLAHEQGLHGSRELRALGIDVNLAPVLDLTVGGNPGIGTRSFGEHPAQAARLGRAIIRGHLEGGVLPTLKHFPGKGAALLDSHIALPTIPEDVDHTPHLQPFLECLDEGAPLVMTSHVVYRSMDPEQPATFSPAIVTELLREKLGFDGPAMTDDLEMGAMVENHDFSTIVQRAAGAGHEIFCIAHRFDRQKEALDVLTRGFENGEAWAGDPDVIRKRLDRLDPGPAPAAPDAEAGSRVAEAIAGRAVTILRDDHGLIPLKGERCLLALPAVAAETGVEDPLRGEDPSALAELLEGEVTVHRLSGEPSDDEVSELLTKARDFDRLLCVTTLARFQKAQASYLRRAVSEHPACIALPLRNPFDCEVIADLPHSAITPYGFRPVHLRALAQVLDGKAESYGRLSVTLGGPVSP